MCDLTPDQAATFTASRLSPSEARAFVHQHACPEHTPWAMGALLLVTSELVTNAVLHGRPPITLHLSCETNEVRLAVRDTGTGVPTDQASSASLGLGLRIVSGVAREWGVTPLPVGKEVWCQVPTGIRPDVPARGMSAVSDAAHR